MKKVMLWESLCESDTLEVFVTMSEYLEGNGHTFEDVKSHVLLYIYIKEQ
jgi:hypothetical protein